MKKLMLSLCLVISSFLLHAQKNYAVKVRDSRNDTALAGVSVKIKANNVTTIANETGTVVIQASETDVLDVSKAGYISREIKLERQGTVISVYLVPAPVIKKQPRKRSQKG